jgi:16S rRNA (adenine1518-N6/adenine1519-N6)-dimethyltransferase
METMQPPDYNSPQSLRAFLDSRGLGMRKRFGQNFLINPNARKRLVDALELNEGEAVWEVGPGLGAMSVLLLERGAQVSAFEIDPGFNAILRETFSDTPRFSLIEGDVLKTWRQNPPGAFLLGNLPYTIAAVLLATLIENKRFFSRMVVTVQKEVAQRIIAKPKTKEYSSFSLLCTSAYSVTPLQTLKGASFYPVPRVDSQGVRFDLRSDAGSYPALFHPLVRHLFASRRKTVKNNLLPFAASRTGTREIAATEIALAALRSCGIPESERAENMALEDFVMLAQALERLFAPLSTR